MKVQDVMTDGVIPVGAEETVDVAARSLTHYNIGALPVCDSRGRLCGMVTDRDLVTRCLASGRKPEQTCVREIMTRQVISVTPQTSLQEAAQLMGNHQIRRLPVVDAGKLRGMVSLGDLARRQEAVAANTLANVSSNMK